MASVIGRAAGLMIQQYIRPSLEGEFGNLQRVSKTRDQWEISTRDRSGATIRTRLNSQRDQAAEPTIPIHVRSGLAQERLFGSIGAWLNNELLLGRPHRLNCEWITNNKRYFIVQIDEEDEDVSGTNPFQVRVPAAVSPAANSGDFLKRADNEALGQWDKLQVLEQLWESEALHKPTLFYVPLSRLPLTEGEAGISKLAADFEKLIGPAGIIVRTSVRASATKIPNLPRTEGLTPQGAARWCFETTSTLASNGLVGLAFVAHRFVASRASAWVRAEPGNPNVEINSTWGLPDALQYCPFDIWEVHVATGVATDYPEYKSDILVSQVDGGWSYVRVKNELARTNSISSTEAKEIASRSLAIAERLTRACHIMWFIGCVDPDGRHFSMPWYWTEAHDAERNQDRSAYRVVTITNRRTLQDFVRSTGPRARQALALRPDDLGLMRDTKFISEVGEAAKAAGIPVILHGSTLAHAYYQLRNAQCTIVTPTEKEHSRIRRPITLGKLVRDKIPRKIAARNEIEVTRQVPQNLHLGFLISKLFEEALEVREAEDKLNRTEELSDLLEIIRAIAKIEEIRFDDVRKTADQKKRKSGGFDEGLILLHTGIPVGSRMRPSEIERSIGGAFYEKVSGDVADLPFTFFGFTGIDQSRSIYFQELHVRLDVTLKSDRLEFRLSREAYQLGFSF